MWLSKKFKYVSLEEVHQLIRNIAKRSEEVVDIFQAYNRVLAENIVSDVDIPPNDVSHVDGYAVRAEDTLQASISSPVLLKIVEKNSISTGETTYVSTGHALPIGANAVIPIERVKVKEDFIEVYHYMRPYENVTRAGSDVKKGDIIFKIGHVLHAQDIKLLIDMRKWHIKCFKKPVVALISVGSELTRQIEETNKKFDSTGIMLSILIKENGGIPLDIGLAPDDIVIIKKLLKKGLKEADIIVTIGGASIGEKDHVWEAINSLNTPEITIRGIKIHPGRVTSLSVVNGKPIIALPGHIQSTLAGFCLVLLPLIQLMNGLPEPYYFKLRAKMSRKMIVKEFLPFKRIRFVKIIRRDDDIISEPVTGDFSSIDSSLTSIITKADGFIIIPENKEVIEENEKVDIYLFKGLHL